MRLATWFAVGLLGGIAGQVFGAAANFSEEMTTLPGTRWGYYFDSNLAGSGGLSDGGLARSIRMGTEPGTWVQTNNYDSSQPYSVTNLNPADPSVPFQDDLGSAGMVWIKQDEADATNTAIGAWGNTYTVEVRFRAAYPDNNSDLSPDTPSEIVSQMKGDGIDVALEEHLLFGTWGYRTYRFDTRQGVFYGDGTTGPDPPAYMFNTKREFANNNARLHHQPNSLIDNQWHTLRIMSDHTARTSLGVGDQGRTRLVVDGIDVNQAWDNQASPVSAGSGDPLIKSRGFVIDLQHVFGDVDRRVNLELDYVRYTDSVLPDNEPLTAEGTGTAGSFTLSGTTNMFIGGSAPVPSASATIPGTDSSRVRARGTLTLGGTLNGRSRNLSYFLEGQANAEGVGERAEQIPDIGQGGNTDAMGDLIPPPTFDDLATLGHRGKKISRAIMFAPTINGSFGSITWNDEDQATTINERGVFAKVRVTADSNIEREKTYPVSMATQVVTAVTVDTVFFEILNAKVGDADGDELVSATDVFIAVNNLGAATVGEDWNRGNFDGDNLVSATDVFAAVNALGSYTTVAVASDISSIPEPTSGLLMVLAMGACAGLRRSRQGR